MVMLTLLLANELNGSHQVGELRALTQGALQAARLPRHRQEQLGRLCRLAVREGDRAAALDALGKMVVDPPDIESDSELRVSAAAVATLLGQSQYVLSVLGPRAGAIPSDETLRPLSSVLRGHAHEQLGQMSMASESLRELPHLGMFPELSKAYAVLKLCPRSSTGQDDTGVSVHRNLQAPIGTGLTVGVPFLTIACFLIGVMILSKERAPDAGYLVIYWLGVGLLLLIGVPLTLGGISSRRRVTFLRQRGIARRARVIQVEGTTSRIGPIPIYHLTLELLGPNGPYRARVSKALHAPQATAIVGQTVGILANPADDTDVILDEADLV